MPVLADMIYETPPDFRVDRGRLVLLAVGWQQGFFVSYANNTVLQEFPFGGYRVVIKFNPYFWAWQSRFWRLDSVLEDFYALPPGGGSPISAGEVRVQFKAFQNRHYELTYRMPALVPTYYFQKFPQAPDDYWAKDRTPVVPEPPYIIPG